ncbi:MAG: nitrate/sulfonate/bicarbonate ABC transporter ATP-binding protein [Fimbriimonadaceae bacterium]|nr:nitrate/sulfonate/bicarbonate ABC transporter ATP-binding protein [Fimbriimonadaceae bacterium]
MRGATPATTQAEPLVRLANLTKTFPRPESGGSIQVLDSLDLSISTGEIVALLGRSGSGKSTMLRLISGLIQPTSGSIMSSGRAVTGPNPDVAMVFQNYALFDWLTVTENVEIGLEAKRVPPREARKKALEALKLVGLEGFAKAYPKELSGGMKQRVGFARAFVVEPRVMLLDEPFSSLDVLTAENLRGEIADLWEDGLFPAEAVLIVTHNIEEAVILADRVVVISANPGRVRGEIRITLPRPRERTAPEFRAMVDHIYTIMTNPERSVAPPQPPAPAREGHMIDSTALPHARPGALSGLLELVEEYGGKEDVASVAERLRMEVDELLPILDTAVLLGFAEVYEGDVILNKIGAQFANAEVEEAQTIFRDAVMQHAPMVRSIYEAMLEDKAGRLAADIVVEVLDESFSEEEAKEQFDTAINWGRYAGLFEYDSDTEVIFVHDETEAME